MADHADWDDVDAVSVDGAPPFAAETDDAVVAWSPAEEAVEDDPFANAFTEELENVAASDWDVDADALWGDDATFDVGMDPGAAAYDFPV